MRASGAFRARGPVEGVKIRAPPHARAAFLRPTTLLPAADASSAAHASGRNFAAAICGTPGSSRGRARRLPLGRARRRHAVAHANAQRAALAATLFHPLTGKRCRRWRPIRSSSAERRIPPVLDGTIMWTALNRSTRDVKAPSSFSKATRRSTTARYSRRRDAGAARWRCRKTRPPSGSTRRRALADVVVSSASHGRPSRRREAREPPGFAGAIAPTAPPASQRRLLEALHAREAIVSCSPPAPARSRWRRPTTLDPSVGIRGIAAAMRVADCCRAATPGATAGTLYHADISCPTSPTTR